MEGPSQLGRILIFIGTSCVIAGVVITLLGRFIHLGQAAWRYLGKWRARDILFSHRQLYCDQCRAFGAAQSVSSLIKTFHKK